tara:strand:+ start:849 stop:986 length:138 start_codon:yes stop_codon:yes gene_type:complete
MTAFSAFFILFIGFFVVVFVVLVAVAWLFFLLHSLCIALLFSGDL